MLLYFLVAFFSWEKNNYRQLNQILDLETTLEMVWSSGSQSVVPSTAAAGSPGNLLEMQFLRAHENPQNQLLGGAKQFGLLQAARWSWHMHWSLTITHFAITEPFMDGKTEHRRNIQDPN